MYPARLTGGPGLDGIKGTGNDKNSIETISRQN
jgi:hypothetical protein